MILHRIELRCVGRFCDDVTIGPFAPGLNILAAPNESGKTTVLHAAARALFDKHTTKGEELKALQPCGTDLNPRVAVEFETRAGRFRIDKTFLSSPRSLLQKWQDQAWKPLAEADAADRRLQELLVSSLPGRGATKPEHWGLLGFLWARQGEAAEWPKLEDEGIGQRIRARLARVELDPVVEKLRLRLEAAAEAVITSSGQPRKNGPLAEAEAELAEIEAKLAELRRVRSEIESTSQRHQHAAADVSVLEKEHIERTASAQRLREEAAAAEQVRGELQMRQVELETAQSRLHAVAQEVATLEARRADLVACKDALTRAEAAVQESATHLAELRKKHDAEEAAQRAAETHLAAEREQLQQTQRLLKLQHVTADSVKLQRQLDQAENSAAQLVALKKRQSEIPAITPAMLRRLDELSGKLRLLEAQVRALGLTVELTPDAPARVLVQNGGDPFERLLPAQEPTTLQSPQMLDLQLPGWGRIVIRSGATEARNLAADLRATELQWSSSLQDAGVPTLEAARDAASAGQRFEAEIKSSAAIHAQHLGDLADLETLRKAAAAAAQKTQAHAAAAGALPTQDAQSSTALEGEEARLTVAISTAEKSAKETERRLAELRGQERAASEALHSATHQATEQRGRMRTLEAQIADLTARHSEGLAATKSAAQIAFTQAEARVAACRAQLPADYEKLPERHRRAAAALQHLSDDLQARRAERDSARGALESLGGQGIYSRETELEERKAAVLGQRDAARELGWSARIAHGLISFRQQAATRAVLRPLQQRLTAAFAAITGDAARKIYLDERLQIAGIGRSREAMHAFPALSQGAREQLLLCLRLAVAQELASDEPHVLILDDVLVNTDAVRQEQILDTLAALTPDLQILILTCHPDRYRGLGATLTLR